MIRKLLIVDEPTAGLDPEERVRFRNLLSELSGERIVILSTHIVSDVEATATEIALISQGTLVAHASPEELLRQVEGKVWEWVIPSADLNAARQRYLISNTVRRSDGVHARVLGDSPARSAAGRAQSRRRLPVLPVTTPRRRSQRRSRRRHELGPRSLSHGPRRLPGAGSPLQFPAHPGWRSVGLPMESPPRKSGSSSATAIAASTTPRGWAR